MAENFIETDENEARTATEGSTPCQENISITGMCPTSMDSLSSPKLTNQLQVMLGS
jgi:hypothetical protein